MEILSNLGRTILSTEIQLKKLNSAIFATDVAVSPLPWGLVTGQVFTDKHANYVALKITYVSGKQEAQMYTQHKYAHLNEIRRFRWLLVLHRDSCGEEGKLIEVELLVFLS